MAGRSPLALIIAGGCLLLVAIPAAAAGGEAAFVGVVATGALLLVAGIAFASWRFYRLNRVLRREMGEREEAERELRASEERHRLLINTAPFPVLITRLHDGLLRFCNPAARRKLGIETKAIEEYRSPTFYVQQSERKRLLALLETHGTVDRFETLLRSRDGCEFWVDMSATRLQYDDEECVFVAFSDVTDRKQMEQRLRRIADTDALTGVASRRKCLQLLEAEIALRVRYGRPACVLSLDLDHFKQINDHYGHPVGDQVLTHFARAVDRILRAPDTLGRLGGEEFVVLLRETNLGEALAAAERIRRAIEQSPLPGVDADARMTVSVGVTEVSPEDTVDGVVGRVDMLLYEAKEAGRNRVCSG